MSGFSRGDRLLIVCGALLAALLTGCLRLRMAEAVLVGIVMAIAGWLLALRRWFP